VAEAEKRIGGKIAWLCDSMDNDLKHALGNAPNCEFVIDPDGNIARLRAWSRPEQLRTDLEELVGPVEHPTDPADVAVRFRPPPKVAATGVVERLQLPPNTVPLRVTADVESSSEPFYVKLRVEASRNLMQNGSGRMYLGFHMDPIYHVHWNNLAAPMTFEIAAPDGVKIDPPRGEGPKLEEPADSDPREFLVTVDLKEPGPVVLTVKYFACNDEEGWCKPVEQNYTIEFEADPDAGWVQGRGRRPRAPRRNPDP
jgi:hypothetical protein